MKKLVSIALALVLALGMCLSAGAQEDAAIRVASLKGPTTMGMAKLIKDSEAGTTQNKYEFTMAGAADEIVPLMVRGELDMALIPCNLASVLYNNTKGAVEVLAVNTLGVLYVLEAGDTVHSVADLAGKTVYSTGKNTTPQYALNYVLAKNGLDPEKDLTVEYKSEATEVAAALANGSATLAMLPQPFVTSVLMQNSNVRVALSLTEEWNKVSDGSDLVTGVVVARREFVESHPEQVKAFLEEYAASTEYVVAHPAEASVWIEELGVVAKAALAEKAIPQCNIVCITGEEMKKDVSGYLAALCEQNPEAVGGTLPDDAFYYIPEVGE